MNIFKDIRCSSDLILFQCLRISDCWRSMTMVKRVLEMALWVREWMMVMTFICASSWTRTINVMFSCVIWVYFKWSFDLIFAWNFWYSHLIVSHKYVYIMFIYTNWNVFGRKSLQIELFFWRGVIISILLMYTILNWMWIPLFWSRYMMWFCVLFMRNNDEMENMGKWLNGTEW